MLLDIVLVFILLGMLEKRCLIWGELWVIYYGDWFFLFYGYSYCLCFMENVFYWILYCYFLGFDFVGFYFVNIDIVVCLDFFDVIFVDVLYIDFENLVLNIG